MRKSAVAKEMKSTSAPVVAGGSPYQQACRRCHRLGEIRMAVAFIVTAEGCEAACLAHYSQHLAKGSK